MCLISVITASAVSTFPVRVNANTISPYVSGAGVIPFSFISRIALAAASILLFRQYIVISSWYEYASGSTPYFYASRSLPSHTAIDRNTFSPRARKPAFAYTER